VYLSLLYLSCVPPPSPCTASHRTVCPLPLHSRALHPISLCPLSVEAAPPTHVESVPSARSWSSRHPCPARPVWTRSEEHLLLCLETWNHFFLRTSSVSALRHQQQYRAAYRLLPTAVHRHCTALLFTGTPLASGFHIAHRCPVTVIRSGLSQALPLFELPPLRALLLPQHSLPRILHITALASP
jgi:hypothetical protein